MIRQYIASCGLALYLLVSPANIHADVSGLLEVNDTCCMIDITGEIKEGDYIKLLIELLDYSPSQHKPFLAIRAMSLGGDVREAIKIGRIIRNDGLTVVVPGHGKCASACVLIYASGTVRIHGSNQQSPLYSNLYIHRPFTNVTGNRTIEEIKKERAEIKALITDYLEEMNVSPRLYDLMDAVAPESSRPLSREELDLLKMGVVDPVAKEKADARIAKELGITKSEYYRKSPICDRFEINSDDWKSCFK